MVLETDPSTLMAESTDPSRGTQRDPSMVMQRDPSMALQTVLAFCLPWIVTPELLMARGWGLLLPHSWWRRWQLAAVRHIY